MDETNLVVTAAILGWAGVIGSTASFLFSLAVLWAFFRLWQGGISLPADRRVLWIGAAFALFFSSQALSGVINYEGWATLSEIAEKLPFLGFLFVYGRLAISPREHILHAVEWGVITGAFATCIFVLIEIMLLGGWRAEGMAGNAGPFAVICALLYGINAMTALRHGGWFRVLAACAAAAAAVCLILSGMRSIWPMLLVAPVLALIILRPPLRARSLAKILLVGAAAITVLGLLTYQTVQTRFSAIATDYESIQAGDYANSLGYRLRMWSAGLELAAERPVFGHGPNDIAGLLATQTGAGGQQPISFSHFHNFALTTVVRSGVVGLAALLAMVAVPIWAACRVDRDPIGDFGLAVMLTIIATYLFSGSVGIMLGHDIMDTLFIFGILVSSFLVLGGKNAEAGGRPGAAASGMR